MSERLEGALRAEVPPEIVAVNLLKKIDDNPAMRVPARVLLSACAAGRQEEAGLLGRLQAQLVESGELPVQPLSGVLEMLVRSGALVESLEVDGEPYSGTLEVAFTDESIADDAEVLIYAEITDAGRAVLAGLADSTRAAVLFAERPEYHDAFVRTLELCDVEGGLSTRELQDGLDAGGFLFRDERTNIPHIYPSLYANLLKDAGCITWNHAWVTTDLGREMAAA